jgi:hypothetical protein
LILAPTEIPPLPLLLSVIRMIRARRHA